jgi:hypothetical protein
MMWHVGSHGPHTVPGRLTVHSGPASHSPTHTTPDHRATAARDSTTTSSIVIATSGRHVRCECGVREGGCEGDVVSRRRVGMRVVRRAGVKPGDGGERVRWGRRVSRDDAPVGVR